MCKLLFFVYEVQQPFGKLPFVCVVWPPCPRSLCFSLAVQPFGKLPFVCVVWQPLP